MDLERQKTNKRNIWEKRKGERGEWRKEGDRERLSVKETCMKSYEERGKGKEEIKKVDSET